MRYLKKVTAVLLALIIALPIFPTTAIASMPAEADGVFVGRNLSDNEVAAEINRLLSETSFTLNADETIYQALASGDLSPFADTGASVMPQDPTDTLTVDGGNIVNVSAGDTYNVTVNRPHNAGYTVAVDWQFFAPGLMLSTGSADPNEDLISGTLVFGPEDTEKTLEVPMPYIEAADMWDGSRPFFLRFFNCDRTSIDEPLIQFNLASVYATGGWTQDTLAAYGPLSVSPVIPHLGEAMPIVLFYSNPVQITDSSTITLQRKGGGSPVMLTPVNAGSTDTYAIYLHTLENEDFDPDSVDDHPYAEITSAAQVTDIYGSDVEFAGADFSASTTLINLRPQFGSVTADKTTYQGNETVTVTVPLLNGDLLEGRGAVYDGVAPSFFALSLDGGLNFVSDTDISYDSSTNEIIATYAALPNADGDPDTYYPEAFETVSGGGVIAVFGACTQYAVAGDTSGFVPITDLTVNGLEAGTNLFASGDTTQKNVTVDITPTDATVQGYSWSSSSPAIAEVRDGRLEISGMTGQATLTLTSDEIAYRQVNGLEASAYGGLTQNFIVKVHDEASLPAITLLDPVLYLDYESVINYFGLLDGQRSPIRFITNLSGDAGLEDVVYDIELWDLTDPDATEPTWKDWWNGPARGSEYAFPKDGATRSKSTNATWESTGLLSPDDFAFSPTDTATGELLPAYRITVSNYLNWDAPVKADAYMYVSPPKVRFWSNAMSPYEAGTDVSFDIDIWNLRIAGGADPTVTAALYKDGDPAPLSSYSYSDITNGKLTLTVANAQVGSYRAEWTAYNADDVTRPASGSSAFSVVDPTITGLLVNDNAGSQTNMTNNGAGNVLPKSLVAGKTSKEILERYADLIPTRWAQPVAAYADGYSYELTAPGYNVTPVSADSGGGTWLSVPSDGKSYRLTVTEKRFKKTLSVNLTADSLQNKLYIFDFRTSGLPDNINYTIRYKNGNNSQINTRIASYNQQIAIYDEYGIAGDVSFSAVYVDPFDAPYTFTAVAPQAELKSGDGLTAARLRSKPANYPINAVRLQHAPDIRLTVTDINGAPIANKDVTVKVTKVDDGFQADGQTETHALTTTAKGLVSVHMPGDAEAALKTGLNGELMFCVELSMADYKTELEFLRMSSGWARGTVVMKPAGYQTPGLDGPVTNHIEDILLRDDIGFSKIKPGATDVYGYTQSANPQLYVIADTNYTDAKFHSNYAAGNLYYNAAVTPLGYASGYYLYTFPYGLSGVMAAESAPRTFYLRGGGLSPRLAVLGAKLSAEEALIEEQKNLEQTLGSGMSLDPDLEEMGDSDDISDDMADAFSDLDFELPLAPLPMSFTVEKRDNVFEVTGIVSVQIPPFATTDLTTGQEAGLEYANAGSALLREIMNSVAGGSTGWSESLKITAKEKASFFTGIKGYITAVATYDKTTGTIRLQLTGGGFILEASGSTGELWFMTPIPLVEVGIVAGGNVTSTTSFKAANVSGVPQSALVSGAPLIDIGFGTNIEITLTLMGGLHAQLPFFEGFAGLRGTGSAGVQVQNIYRHYLKAGGGSNWNQYNIWREQGGMKQSVSGKLEIGVFVGVGDVRAEYFSELWSASVTHYSPDNYLNPLHPDGQTPFVDPSRRMQLSNAQLTPLAFMPLAATDLANGVDFMASPKYNDDGSMLAYLQGGKVYAQNGAAAMIDPQSAYPAGAFDLGGTSSFSVAAWEAYKDTVDTNTVDEDNPDAMAAFFAGVIMPAEIFAGVSTGSGFTVTQLSDNSLADLSPKTAANATDALVVWQQGAVMGVDLNNAANPLSFDGRLVFSRYASGWSAMTEIMELDAGTRVAAYDAAMASDGAALVAIELDRGNGAELVYALIDAQGDVTLIQNGEKGAAPQVALVTVNGGERFLIGYRSETTDAAGNVVPDYSFTGFETDGQSDPLLSFSAGIANPGTGFRFLKGESGIDESGIIWQTSDIILEENGARTSNTLHIARFVESGAGFALSAAKELVSDASGDLIPAFDAYINNGAVSAAVLHVDTDGINGTIQSATDVFANEIIVSAPIYTGEIAAPAVEFPVSFNIVNAGASSITKLEITMDGETTTFDSLAFAPLAVGEYSANYAPPATAGATSISIKAYFADSTDYTYEATANIAAADVAVKVLAIEEDGTGQRSAIAGLTNEAQFALASNSAVSLGLYADSLGGQAVAGTTPYRLSAADIANINEGGMATAKFALPAGSDIYAVASADGDGNPVNNTAFIQNASAPEESPVIPERPTPSGGSGEKAPAPPVNNVPAETPLTVSKARLSYISGADRVLTSVAISRQGWPSADTVILAPGGANNLIDALAVAPLAGQENAPILLCVGGLDPAVIAEIERLGAKKVYAVGALSETVIEALKAALPGLTVETLRGANRFETAALINAKVQNPKGTFIVGYNAIADAVSAASYAAANGYLIQIAQPDGTLTTDHYPLPTDHYILGGPALVGDVAGATRLYGPDRYATNKAIREALTFEYTNIYTADGATLVDALTGSALAAKTKAAIVLIPAGDPTGADFGGITPETMVYAFGGGK